MVGYFAKEPLIPAEAETLGAFDDVASVSECIVSGADDWHKHWKHNTEGEHPFSMPSLGVDPPGAGYELLGYDIVELGNVGRNGDSEPHYEFGCSPLTCNSLDEYKKPESFDAVVDAVSDSYLELVGNSAP